MNTNLNGTPLTREQLVTMAVEAGVPAEKVRTRVADLHNEALATSWLLSVTRERRLDLLGEGKVTLCTRNRFNTPGFDPATCVCQKRK